MAFNVFEKYCKKCGFVYLDTKDIPDNEDVIEIGCDCGKFHIIHRCIDGTYNEVSVREVQYHEHDKHKEEYEKKKVK